MAIFGGSIPRSLLLCSFIVAFISVHSFRLDDAWKSGSNSIYSNIKEDSSACAQTCSNTESHLIEYKQGQTYTYQIQLSTRLNANSGSQSPSTSTNDAVSIRAIADLSVHQPCQVVIRIRQAQIDGIENAQEMTAMKEQLESQSTHFTYENGRIGDVCSEHDEPEWTVNIKKSIMSAIQMSAETIKEKSEIIETDINGQCKTEYTPINQWTYGTSGQSTVIEILKRKELSKCNKRFQINVGLFPRSYGLDQLVRSAMPMVNATYECRQKIQDGIVIDSKCCDKQTIWPLNVIVDSDIHVTMIDQQQGLTVAKSTGQLKRQNMDWMSAYGSKDLASRQKRIGSRDYSVDDVQQLLQQICNSVQGSVQIQVPQFFSELVRAKQFLSVEDERQLYESIKSGRICNTPKIIDIYLDASALSGSEGSIEALIQAYQQQQQTPIFPQKFPYLFSLLAFSKTPTVEAAKRLVQFVQEQQYKSEQDLSQIILGVTGFIHNLRQDSQDVSSSQPQQATSKQEIESLVKTLQTILVERLEQCIQQLPQVNASTCLIYAYGIENIGVQSSSDEQWQQSITQKLIDLVKNSRESSLDAIPIRVTIIRSLVDSVDEQSQQYLLNDVFMSEQEPTVVRIEAYKTVVMSGAKISQLQAIQSYVDSVESRYPDLVNYVRSHQANLRSTSDLHRRSILPVGAPEFRQPIPIDFSLSRNYEFSYLNDVYQVGVTAEADVIFQDNQNSQRSLISVPQVVDFNLTIPIMGKEFQAVHVRVQQNGLRQVLEEKLRTLSSRSQKTIDPFTLLNKLIDVVSQEGSQVLDQNPQFRLLIQVAVDGKTLAMFDQNDLVSYLSGTGQIGRFLRDLFSSNSQQRQVSIDRAFAMIPIDFSASMSTSNGMPVQVQVNSSVVLGLKSDVNINIEEGQSSVVEFSIWPSVASQWESRVQYSAGNQVKLVQNRVRIHSAPQFNMAVQFSEQDGVNFRWTMPEKQYTLIRYESSSNYQQQPQSQSGVSSGLRSLIDSSNSGPSYRKRKCTDFTKKPLGVTLCYDVEYQNEPQQSGIAFEISVEKFDQQMNSLEIHVDNPISYLKWMAAQYGISSDRSRSSSTSKLGRQSKRSLKLVFNTPGSEIDRELAFEMELPILDLSSSDVSKEARIRIQSPWKQIIAQAVARNQDNERLLRVELSVDKQQYFLSEIGYELIKRGQKTEYRSKMILITPIMPQPINLAGVLSYEQGQKTLVHVSLEDIQDKRQYVKATFVKTGQFNSADLKSSTHCMVNLAGIIGQVSGTLERSERDIKLDLNTDYKVASRASQSARLVVKFQNQSWGKMTKVNSQASWSWTEAPQYDAQYHHHLVVSANEYLENDLKLGWNGDAEKFRAYQSLKMAGQRGKYDIDSQTILTVKPLDIDYEVKAQSSLVGVGANSQQQSYDLVAMGHSRDGSESGKIKAEVSYQKQSQQPLKMKMRASVKSESGIDFAYSDDIEERQPNKYNGHVTLQMSPKEKYSADYVYSIEKSSSSDEYNHDIDVTFNNDITKRLAAKHHGQLRFISDRLVELKSKWTDQENKGLFDGSLKLDKQGASNCQFQHYPSDTQAELHVDPYSKPAFGSMKFKRQDLDHASTVQYDLNKKLFKLKSETQQKGKNVFSMDSDISPEHQSHFSIESRPFRSQCQFDTSTDEKMGQIRFQLPEQGCSHESKVMLNPNSGKYELKSRTDYKDETVAEIDGKYHQGDKCHFKVRTPSTSASFSSDEGKKYDFEFKNDRFNHKSKLDYGLKSAEFESKTVKDGKSIATIQYACGEDKAHKIKLDCDDLMKAEADYKLSDNKPYANVGVIWQKANQPLEHQTSIRANRDEKSIFVDSQTKLSNDKLAQIKAAIAKSPVDQKPYARVAMNSPRFNAAIGYEQPANDEHQVELAYEDSDFEHHSKLGVQKRSIFDVKSETKSKKNKSKYLEVDGQYRHEDEEQPSKFDVKFGKMFQTIAKFNLRNPHAKSFDMNGEWEDSHGRKYQHQTEAKYLPDQQSLKIESQIANEIGQKLAMIKSMLSNNPDETLYFRLDSQNVNKIPSIHMEMNRRMKRAAIDVDMDQYKHSTQYQNDNSALKINTVTTKNQENIFNFNSEIDRQPTIGRSKVNVQVGPKYQTSLNVYPSQRTGAFFLQTPSVRHESELDFNPSGPASTVKSVTHYHNDLLAALDARLEGLNGENVVKTNVPSLLLLDSSVDVPEKRASFDVQSDQIGRHIIGSMYASTGARRRGSRSQEGPDLHFDLAWDVDRDPRSRILVHFAGRRQSDNSVMINALVDYAHNKLNLKGQLTPHSIIANSAQVSVSYVPYGGIDSWEVVYTHLNHLPQIECKLEFLFRGQLKYAARITTQITDQRFVFGFQTTSPQNVDAQIDLNVMGVVQGQGQYYLKASLQQAVEDRYEIEATANQDQQYPIYFGQIEIRVPRTETQTIEYRADVPGRYFSVQLMNPKQAGRKFKLEGQIQEQIVQMTLESDLPLVRAIDGKIKYVPNEEFYANFDLDTERLVEIQYKQKGFDSIASGGFYFLAKLQSVWTPTLEFTAQSSRPQGQGLVITVEGKYNVEKILYGQLKQVTETVDSMGKQSITFAMEGWVSRPNGVKLIQTVSKFVVGGEDQNVIEYVLDIEPNRNELETIEPIYIVASAQRKPDGSQKLVGTIKVSHGTEKRDLIEADLVVENIRKVFHIPFPERIVSTVRYVPTSTQGTLEISLMERLNEATSSRQVTLFDDQTIQPQLNNIPIYRKYRNQFLVTIDDRKAGFELISNQMAHRNTYEHTLKMYSTKVNGRAIQYRTAYHIIPETFTYFYRSELKSGPQQNEPLYQSTVVWAPIPNKPTSYLFYYDLQSPLIAGHVSARAFVFGPENKYQGVVATLKTTQNDEITFEATTRTEEEQSNQLVYFGQGSKVSYFNVTLYTRDQSIDVGIDGQMSRNGVVFNWHNQNRYGQPQSGSYRFQIISDSQFEANIEHGNFGYQAKGQFKSKQGVLISDILVDQYQKVPIQQGMLSQYYGSRQQKRQQQLIGQYKVHIEAKDQCIQTEIVDQQQPSAGRQQLSLCMDLDQSNILNLAIDSIKNGQKTSDLNIRLDTREVVNSIVLSLKWNPKSQRTFLQQVSNKISSVYDRNEIVSEVEHVVRVLKEKLGPNNSQQINGYQNLVEELIQIADDFGVDVYQWKQTVQQSVIMPVIYVVQDVTQSVVDYFSLLDKVINTFGKALRTVQNECYNSDLCRNSVQSLLSIDSVEKLISVISDRMVDVLQHTHRIISSSQSSRWIRSWIPSTVTKYIPDVIHQVSNLFVNGYVRALKGNSPLAELVENIENIVHSMIEATHWRSVEWNQVKNAVDNIVGLAVMPIRYPTTTRVLVYDPQEGRLQIELYGPAVKHPRYYQTKYNDLVHWYQSDNSSSGYNQPNNSAFGSPIQTTSSIFSNLFGQSTGRKRRSVSGDESITTVQDSKRLKLSSTWVELMLVRNQFDNYSAPFRIVEEELGNVGKPDKNVRIFSLKIAQKDLIAVHLTNKNQIKITFVQLLMQINQDLEWTVKNSTKHQSIDSLEIIGNTIEIAIHQDRHLPVDSLRNLSIKFIWTPARQLISIETELNLNDTTKGNDWTTSINFALKSSSQPESEGALMFGQTSMLDLIDDVFPDDPFFSANNLSTLMRDGMNLRQSLCFHWMMYYGINHTKTERLTCHRINDLCNLIGHFVRRKQLFRTPNYCLSCIITTPNQTQKQNSRTQVSVRFGSRRHIHVADQADVIFLLDGTCHQVSSPKSTLRFMLQLNRFSKTIERQFRSNQIKTSFMILTANADGQYKPIWPRSEPRFNFSHLAKLGFRNRYERNKNDPITWDETFFRETLWKPDGKHSLDFLYTYSYSPRKSSRHFIMIDCAHLKDLNTSSTCQERDIDFNTARDILLQSNNYLHLITGIGLAQKSFSSPQKMRRIIGIDWQQVMFDNSMSNNNTSSIDQQSKHLGRLLRQYVLPHRDICHVLALETNGSIFNHRAIKQINRKIMAERLVSNHKPTNICQRCDCTLAKDFLTAQQECLLCESRTHTLVNPYYKIRDEEVVHQASSSTLPSETIFNQWPFNIAQEWTEDDQKQFLESQGDDETTERPEIE